MTTYLQAVYQSLLHLSWVDKLLDNVKTIFVDLYQDQLKKPNTSIVECPFDEYFDQQTRELEGSSSQKPPNANFKAPLPSSAEGQQDEPPPLPGMLQGKIERRPSYVSAMKLIISGHSTIKFVEQACAVNRCKSITYARCFSTCIPSSESSSVRTHIRPGWANVSAT